MVKGREMWAFPVIVMPFLVLNASYLGMRRDQSLMERKHSQNGYDKSNRANYHRLGALSNPIGLFARIAFLCIIRGALYK